MPTRAIHTVFTVGGENTYRDAVKRINAQIKELNSELELTKERFAGQEDSYTALFTKQQQMERLYEAQSELAGIYANRLKQIQDNTNELNRYSEELRDTLNQIQAALHNTSETSVGYDELAREAKDVEEELRAVETQMGKNATKASELETGINKAHTEMERLARELADIDPLVDEAASSMDGLAQSMEEAAEDADGLRERGTAALEALASAEIMDRAKDSFRDVASLMQDCIDKYVEFESAIAGVEKTVDASDAEMEALTKGIKDLALEIPASTTEIASVAEAAGQLGIATGDILDFTEVMIKLGTSTNMSATEAADSLARLSNITDMDPSNYERLGSTIVDLGNKTATTETEIVEMATRLAATGDLVGLSVPQILAMSAALSSLGIEAEAGGTAASKLFKKLETAVQGYEPALEAVERTGMELRELELLESNQSKVFKETADSIGLTSTELGKYMDNIKLLGQVSTISGKTAEDFVKAWGTDAVSALDLFVTGLGDMEKSGGNAVNALNEIAGFTEVRLSNAILALASSGGLLTETMDTANTAWEANSALAEEAAKRYETTESKITILQNAVDNLEVALGEDFMAAASPVIEGLTSIATGAADAAEESPALASALAGVGGALGGLAGLATVAGGIQLINSALGIFGTMAGPVGIGVAALGGLAAAVTVYQANVKELSEEAKELITVNDNLLEEVDRTQRELEASGFASAEKQTQVELLTDKIAALSDEVNKTDADKIIVQNYVDQLNGLLPGLGLTFDNVTGKVNLSRDAILNFAKAAEETAKMEALQKYIQDVTGQQVGLEVQMAMTTEQIKEAEQKYEDAAGKLAEFTEGQTLFQKALNYTNPVFLEYKAAVDQAKNEVDTLKTSHEDMKTALENVEGELETAKGVYQSYQDELRETADTAKEAGEGAASGYADGVEEKASEIEDAGKTIGGSIAAGIAAGMEDGQADVAAAAMGLAKTAVDEINRELEIRSPSRKARKSGNWFGEGMVLGLEDKASAVEAAADRMARNMDISGTLSRQAEEANRQIRKIRDGIGEIDGIPKAVMVQNQMAGIHGMMQGISQDSALTADGRMPVQITVVNELDGEVLSRKVSEVQWAENDIMIRASGVMGR